MGIDGNHLIALCRDCSSDSFESALIFFKQAFSRTFGFFEKSDLAIIHGNNLKIIPQFNTDKSTLICRDGNLPCGVRED